MKKLSKAGLSMFVYGIYVFFLWIGVLTMQEKIMPLMWMPAWTDHWVYIVWVFAVALSYYYIFSARAEDKTFFKLSVVWRIWFFCATSVLILLQIAPIMIIWTALVDLLWAIWTWLTLRKALKK